jgi:hypothetical protein
MKIESRADWAWAEPAMSIAAATEAVVRVFLITGIPSGWVGLTGRIYTGEVLQLCCNEPEAATLRDTAQNHLTK